MILHYLKDLNNYIKLLNLLKVLTIIVFVIYILRIVYKEVSKDLFFPAKIAIDTRWGEFLCFIKEKELKNESDSL